MGTKRERLRDLAWQAGAALCGVLLACAIGGVVNAGTMRRAAAEPMTVRAGGRTFRVLDQAPPDVRDVGEVWFGPGRIYIDPAASCDGRKEILLHELMHVAGHYDERGKIRGEKWPTDEDAAIERLAPALLRIFQDNPEVGSYLSSHSCQ